MCFTSPMWLIFIQIFFESRKPYEVLLNLPSSSKIRITKSKNHHLIINSCTISYPLLLSWLNYPTRTSVIQSSTNPRIMRMVSVYYLNGLFDSSNWEIQRLFHEKYSVSATRTDRDLFKILRHFTKNHVEMCAFQLPDAWDRAEGDGKSVYRETRKEPRIEQPLQVWRSKHTG